MKFQLINTLGQLQVFTQYDNNGEASTIRLYADKPLIIEANSKDDLPKDIKLAIKARYVIAREVVGVEEGKVMGAFPNNEGGGK